MHRSLSAKIFSFVVITAAGLTGFAAADSNRIDLNLIKYSSAFEKSQFIGLSSKNIFDPLSFLLCLDSTANESKAGNLRIKLNRFFDDKLATIQKSKSGDKLIKAVFKEIHDNMLTKYVTDAHFEKILDNGEYNCVTASALYALSFQKLGIPYQLRSTTDHVYIIANPGPNQLLIETTDPVGGAFAYSEQFKKGYLEMLLKQKIISKKEYNESDLEALFQKHFYSADTIDIRQLIGYHYYNSGVELMHSEDYDKASSQLMKAYYLNTKKQVGHMLSLTLAVQLNKKFDITDSANINLFFLFSQLFGETDYDFLYNKYVLNSEDLIMRHDDLDKFKKISLYIFEWMSDSVQLNKFREHYYYACAYGYVSKKDFASAYQNIRNAYCINDKNIRIKNMYDQLSENLLYFLAEESEEGSLDSAIVKLVNTDAICGKGNSSKLKFELLMVRAGVYFNDNDINSGDQALAEAEKFATENKLSDFEDRYIEMGYGSANNYYYRKYEIAKAKEYLNRGLKLDPDNIQLKNNLDMLNKMGDLKRQTGSFYPSPPPPPGRTKSSEPSPRTIIVKTPH